MPSVTSLIRHPPVLLLALCFGLAVGCQTAAPPPPPAPSPEPAPAAPAAPAPPPETVHVTGSRLNVRAQATTSSATVGRVKRGETLTVVGRDGDWVQVRLADGTTGWVSGRYVAKDEPICRDKTAPDLLSDVPLSFHEGAAIGRVVIEATVDESGSVTGTKVVQDTTSIPELQARALEEVKVLKFAPPTRNCRPIGFIYTYTRDF